MASNGKLKRSKGFAFDLSKPIKRGVLLKQGALHKAFRSRFFVLYPGFLVYYESESKWKLDVTRGDTMQSRQGAIKLKNGTANVCKHPPKGCKFGIVLHAPDPSNNRQSYLINAASREDREMWVEALTQATPHSPRPGRKDPPANTTSPKAKEDDKPPKHEDQPPQYVRQETVDKAAIVASEAATTNGHAEESVTSIDRALEPSMSVRRDTSSSAALSIASTTQEEGVASLDHLTEEDEPVISIDDALGPSDEVGSEADLLDKPNLEDVENGDDQDNTTENDKATQNGVDRDTATEVVTTVAVVCNGEAVGDNKRREDESSPTHECSVQSNNSSKPDVQSSDSNVSLDESAVQSNDKLSAEVVIPSKDERHNSFTINATDPDGSTDEEDGDGSSLAESLSGDTSPTATNPPLTSSTPAITLDPAPPVEENNQQVTKEVPVANGDPPKLSPPTNRKNNDGRRPSAAFIQKVGYLYKLGGQRKNWKLRYFVLNPGVFFYYKNPKSTKPLGEVKLKNAMVYFPKSGERKTSYQFGVHTESQWNKRSEWIIAAQSDREMKEWIDAFKAASNKGTPSPSGSPSGSFSGSEA